MSAPYVITFAHVVPISLLEIAKKVAGKLGPGSGDSRSYDALKLSADGNLPESHRVTCCSVTEEFAAQVSYLQGSPEGLFAAMGGDLTLQECQDFCANTHLHLGMELSGVLEAEGLHLITEEEGGQDGPAQQTSGELR